MIRPPTAPAITWIIVAALLVSTCASMTLSSSTHAQTTDPQTSTVSDQTKDTRSALQRYAVDLTELALEKRIESVEGFDHEIARVVARLSEDSAKAPLVISQSDLDRGAIARGVALRIASDNVPESLRGKRVYSVNLDALAKGAKTSHEFEQRLEAVFAEAESHRDQLILFVDQLQQYAGTRATPIATATVKRAIAATHLRVIAGVSPEAYAAHISSDEAVARLFESISIDRFSQSTASSLSSDRYEFEGDKVSPDLREMIEKSPSDRVKVILQAENIKSEKLRNLLRRHNVQVGDQFQQLGTLTVELPVSAIEELAASDLTSYISLDRDVRSLQLLSGVVDLLDGSEIGHVENTTGAVTMRSQSGNATIDGDSVGIAVIDSGLFREHYAMDKIVFQKDFTNDGKGTVDKYGHGTHVTGLIATRDSVESFTGIAPKASIINLRVLDSRGVGSVSTLIRALNWILEPADPNHPAGEKNHQKYKIRVVNLSLGTLAIDSYKNDPLCRAARRLVDTGIVVVAAAGNNGKDSDGQKLYGHIHSPGNEPSVITVGASNTYGTDARDDDTVATFSSRGPTRSYTRVNGVKKYDNLIKPDLVAPGNKLIAAEAATRERINGTDQIVPNYLMSQYPELRAVNDSDYRKRMMRLSGSSMAAPIVSGAAALLLHANPKLTPNMVKMILMYTAQPLQGANMLEQGTGQLNIEGAVRLAKQVRIDLNWETTPLGTRMLKTTTLPSARSTIAGKTFTWAQGILVNYTYAKGTNLIMRYQKIYGQGAVLGDAIVLGDGVVVGDGVVIGDGILLGDNIMRSDGVVIGDGTVFLPCHALFGNGVVIGDGVVLGDGVVIGDGVVLGDGLILSDGGRLTSDGVVLGDGVVIGDGLVLSDSIVRAMSLRAMVYGDPGPSMRP